jgi:hypothetical protein
MGTTNHELNRKSAGNAEHAHKMHIFSAKARARVRDSKWSSRPCSVDMIPHRKNADHNSFDTDINTLETMDIDSITGKIRGECESLIKQLHLEHLTAN